MAFIGKSIFKHVIAGVAESFGKNNKVSNFIKAKVGAEPPAPEDDGIVTAEEVKLEEIRLNESYVKSIKYAVYVAGLVILYEFFPESTDKVINLVLSALGMK